MKAIFFFLSLIICSSASAYSWKNGAALYVETLNNKGWTLEKANVPEVIENITTKYPNIILENREICTDIARDILPNYLNRIYSFELLISILKSLGIICVGTYEFSKLIYRSQPLV